LFGGILTWNLHGTHVQDGDIVELVGLRHKRFIITMQAGAEFQTHRGVLKHDDLIGKPWGSQVFSHNGSPFFLLQPPLGDLISHLPRNSQILYPKDIGYILLNMGIGEAQQVLEAGTGSGSMTCSLAFSIGKDGHVTSYDIREDMQKTARKNIERLGLSDRVTFKLRDIAAGFDETNMDAVFLDVPNPFDYIEQVRAALKPGGFFGCILPTINQVTRLLTELRNHDFAFMEVVEILLRFYKPEPTRIRPVDRMVAHTGFLIFARPMIFDRQAGVNELLEEIGAPVETAVETPGE
jgi:tRNA (adenine57-N1/adenine58-N1)-methyltransferase